MVATAPIVTNILTTINTVITWGRENQKIQGEIEGSLGLLKREVQMAEWDMAKCEGTDENLTLQMQELLCDIDDFTSNLLIPDKAAAFFNSVLAKDLRLYECARIQFFQASIKSIADRQKESSKQGNGATNLSSAAAASNPPYAPEKDLDEGFLETKKEFEELLSPALGGQLRVISIVGCSGLGKTALARAVYEATPVQPSPSGTEIHRATTEIHEPVATDEASPVQQFPPTTEIHELIAANGATPLQSSPPTIKNLEHVVTNEDTRVHPSPATTEIHELITANGATPVQSSPPARAAYESTPVQINGGNKTTRVPPSPPTTEIHEVVAAKAATPVQPSPTAEICQPIAYNCKAWVEASTCKDPKDLLNKVLITLDPTAAGGNDTSEAIKKFLVDIRYLIIIDDLPSSGVQWKDIEHAFPKNCKDSRIIVTTSVHSIARDYSSARYYVYPLQCLDEANSEGLFRKQVFARCSRVDFSYPEKKLSENILAKCGGLPLALISAGNYLCWKEKNPHLSDDSYNEVCTELDNILASDKPAFGAMKKMFAQRYNDLTDYDHKMCLLYLSIFPRGHQINSKSFVRRLKGEALVPGDVLKCLKVLIDRSMIEPSLTRNNCNVAKRCEVQGMMLEFIIHKSMSRNLVTLVDKGIVRQNKTDGQIQCQKKVRRLTVQSGSSNKEERSSSSAFGVTDSSSEEESSSSSRNNLIPDGIELSAVRSLTIFKSELLHSPQNTKGKHNLPPMSKVNFNSCKMVRVLDLEGCKGLNTVVGDICELLFLKYLSLKNTDLEKLPKAIKNLKRLGMLDIRQSRVEILQVAVIMLPELSHLFGEFEIPQLAGREAEDVTKFLKEKSKLHTLAGIVIKETPGFEILIRNARNLKKVKLYGGKQTASASASKRTSWIQKKISKLKDRHSAPAASAPSPEHKTMAAVLVSSLRKRSLELDSISIESDCFTRYFISSTHKASSVLSSLKLRGPLASISGSTLEKLCNLSKLHLFSTDLIRSKDLVTALQSLMNLQYLKLSEEDGSKGWEGDFSVGKGKFSALLELCFEGTVKYPRMKIAEGAMGVLKSLQLLCPHPVMVVQGMEHLELLDEVILHHTADVQTVQAWKEAAKKHTNMPCVKKQPAQPISNAV